VRVEGKRRVEAVVIAQVDDRLKPIPGTEQRIECDTLLLSVGLIPENELSRAAGVELSSVTRGPVVTDRLETSVEGIFAAGNVLHVHDLVDFVSEEAALAGAAAAAYAAYGGAVERGDLVQISCQDGVRYTVPTKLSPAGMGEKLKVRFRVDNVYRDRYVSVYAKGRRIVHRRRQIMAPGEMEEVVLKRTDLEGLVSGDEIVVRLEEE